MRAAGVPLFSVENHLPARAFDVLAFNLSAELVYTNVLNLVDLAGVPVRAGRPHGGRPARGGRRPLRLQPRAPGRLRRRLRHGRRRGGGGGDHRGHRPVADQPRPPRDRADVLEALAGVAGRLRPGPLPAPLRGGRLVADRAPAGRARRAGWRSARWPTWPTGPTPAASWCPLTEVVHDRLNVEVFRGCTRGCRFCQAGMITRPVRERPAEQVRQMVRDGLERTGYDEVALTSLSTRRLLGHRGRR